MTFSRQYNAKEMDEFRIFLITNNFQKISDAIMTGRAEATPAKCSQFFEISSNQDGATLSQQNGKMGT